MCVLLLIATLFSSTVRAVCEVGGREASKKFEASKQSLEDKSGRAAAKPGIERSSELPGSLTKHIKLVPGSGFQTYPKHFAIWEI